MSNLYLFETLSKEIFVKINWVRVTLLFNPKSSGGIYKIKENAIMHLNCLT